MNYVGGYVGSVDACLNYPFYYYVKDTLFNFREMTKIRQYYDDWGRNMDKNNLKFMGNFLDNHDNARTLSN